MSKLNLLEGQDLPQTLRNATSIKREIFSFIWSISNFGEYLHRKYEFSSPVFSPKLPGISKWKLAVFSENAYPEGVQVALRLHKVSADYTCYSVMYTISLIDINGKEHQFHTKEKVFRNYLEYDECTVASNQAITDKKLLQNNDTLVICCKMDLLECENPDDMKSDSLQPYENTNIPVENDISRINTYKKQTEYEKNIISLSTTNDLSCANPCQKSMEKMENRDYNKETFKCHEGLKISFDEEGRKKASGLSEKIKSSINTTKEKAKNSQLDSKSSKNYKSLEILSKDLNFLFTTKYQHDVTIQVDDGRIRAHKSILAARSDYFRRTLTQKDVEIHIQGISGVTMDSILYYMYTGQSPEMTFDHAIDILTACNTFHLDHLSDIAENSLKSQINISNVIDIFHTSKEMKLDNLKICVLKFVAQNHETVTKTLKWNQMMTDDPHSAGEILLTIASFKNKSNNSY